MYIGIGTMTWSPLACGLLTGKYDDGVPLHSRSSIKSIHYDDVKKSMFKVLFSLIRVMDG